MAILLVSSCTGNTNDKKEADTVDTIPMMVAHIRKCSKIYTTEYKIRKIVSYSDNKNLKGKVFGKEFSIDIPMTDRKLAMPVTATIKGYIDRSGFSTDNVKRKGDRIVITLPDPKIELTSTKVIHDETHQHVDMARRNFSDKELATLAMHGRDVIVKSLDSMSIARNAMNGAAHVLIPIIKQMGFKEENIEVRFRNDFKKIEIVDENGKRELR